MHTIQWLGQRLSVAIFVVGSIWVISGETNCDDIEKGGVKESAVSIKMRRHKSEYLIEITNNPGNIVPLKMAPLGKEVSLNSGSWLILVVAVWSRPDREAFNIVESVASRLNGKCKIGIRPFAEYEETISWLPQLGSYGTPVWIVAVDGKVQSIDYGLLTENEVLKITERTEKKDK